MRKIFLLLAFLVSTLPAISQTTNTGRFINGLGAARPTCSTNVNDQNAHSGDIYNDTDDGNTFKCFNGVWGPLVGVSVATLPNTTLAFSATPAFNGTVNAAYSMILTGNVTSSTVSGVPVNGNLLAFHICQDSGGSHTFAWPGSFLSPTTIQSTANFCTDETFKFDGTNWSQLTQPATGGSGGGSSVGPQGTFQEVGNTGGSFAAAPCVDLAGAGVTIACTADLEWNGGPNPWVDARKFARQLPPNSTPIAAGINATCSSGSPNVTLSGLPTNPLINGDGVNIYHCGASNAVNTPAAPTVTPGGPALGMGTRIDKPSVSPTVGATSYTYYAVGVTPGRGTSAPSPATVITTGQASLGVQSATITSIVISGQTATLTTATPHTISPGYEIGILSVLDASGNNASRSFDGDYSVVTVPDTTHITYKVRQSTLNGQPPNGFGGTIFWTNSNRVVVTDAGGYEFYVVYGRTPGSIAPVCVTGPVNAALVGDQTYLACNDYGGTVSGNLPLPEWLSATLPVGATNDNLTTTILSGSPAGAPTTSLVLNANAGASGTNGLHFDNSPNYVTAATYANGIGAPLYLAMSNNFSVWFNASPVPWPSGTKLLQAGQVVIGDTWEAGNNMSSWEGVAGAPCVRPQFALVCAPSVSVKAAFPGFYGKGQKLSRLTFLSGTTNNPIPLVLLDAPNDDTLDSLNFSGSGSSSEYLFIGLELRGHHSNGTEPFTNVLNLMSFTGGPNQVNYSSTAPLFYCNTCGWTTFGPHSIGRRGFVFRIPDSGAPITMNGGYNQGNITPWIRAGFADSGRNGTNLTLTNFAIDTSPMPLVSSLLNSANQLVVVGASGTSNGSALTTGPFDYETFQNSGAFTDGSGANTNFCLSQSIFDSVLSPGVFGTSIEGVCDISTQTNITPGYSIFTSDINLIAPTCTVTNTGPPFTPAGTNTFTDEAIYFNGGWGSVSPPSNSCTSNGSQQVTVTLPALLPGAIGWQIFHNGFTVGVSSPSTTTTSYLFLVPNGGSAPKHPGSGPAGMQAGKVWGDIFLNSPNNTPSTLATVAANGQVVSTPYPSAGVPLSTGSGFGTSYTAPVGNIVGTGQSNNFTTGIQDLSNVTEFRPKAGLTSALPATCTGPSPMDVYLATDAQAGRNWYFCTATNVWTQQINTGFIGLNTYSGSHTMLASESWANFTATATATVPHANLTNRWVIYNASVSGTLTIAPDSGNVTLNSVTAATATVAAGLGVEITCDGTNCFAWGLGGSGSGSGTVSSCTVNGVAYYSAATITTCVIPPTSPNGVPETVVSTPSGGLSQPPAMALPGITGRAVSGTAATDTILSTDCNPNRVEYIGSVAVAVTLPTAVTLGVPKCVFKLVNTTSPAQPVTITPTTWTINGGATIQLVFGQQLWVYVDPNSATNWVADQTDLVGNINGAAVPATAKILGTNGSGQPIAAALSNTHIYVGNASNLPVDVAVNGDETLANTGAFTVTGVNGATLPVSANVVGTNSSKQIIAATAHNIVLPWECADTSGSGSAQVCNTTPTFTPVAGDSIIYTTTTANTGTGLTLNVNSLGAKPAAKWQTSTTLVANDIRANTQVLLTYDGTNWEITTIGNAPAGGGGTPCTTTAFSLQYNNGGAFGCLAEFTYASSTITLSSTGKIDMSAASVTAGLHVPQAAGAAPTNGGIVSYDTTTNNLVWGNATNTSHAHYFTTTPTTNVLRKSSGTSGLQVDSSITDNGTLISTTEGVSIAPTSTSQVGAIVNTPTSTSVDIADFQVNAINKATIGNTGTLTLGTATCTTLGTAGGLCAAEGTEPTNVSGAATITPDSTTHEIMVATNGASTATPGMLVRSQPSPIHQTGKTASITTATLCAASAGACNIAGQYHLNFTFIETGTACSSVVAGSVTLQLTWTDSNGTAHSAVSIPMDDASSINTVSGSFHFATSLANAWASGDFNISTNGSVIQYATTYTGCTTGTGTYQLDMAVTRVQ